MSVLEAEELLEVYLPVVSRRSVQNTRAQELLEVHLQLEAEARAAKRA